MPYATKRYISDLHFGHELMLKYPGRPFSSTTEMDEFMIREWNSVVRPDDLTYILGDFSMGLGDVERVTSIYSRLMGRKRLILGNHDYRKAGQVHPTLLGLEWDAPPTPAVETTDEGQRLYLCHYASRVWPGSHKGSYHFYGHSHGALPAMGRSRDVGVDMPDVAFRPRTFPELTKGMI